MINVDINSRLSNLKCKKITKWMVADEVGISDTTFSKWLRKELTPERREQVLAAIERLSKGAVD